MKPLLKVRIFRYLIPVVVVLTITFTFRYCNGHPRDYAAIAKEGVLHVAIECNSIGYYKDSDTIAGFHYELIQAFARNKGLTAEITPLTSFNEQLSGLRKGRFDLIACGIPTTCEQKDILLLTSPIFLCRQVLVQRKATCEDDSLYIRNQLDLAGKTLHVVKSSPSILRIRNLANEIGDTIYINEIKKCGTEQLMALVATGDIDYAVCDEDIARAALDSFPQLDINIGISLTQFYSWAAGKRSPALLDSLNRWIDHFREENEFRQICEKYHEVPYLREE